MPSTISQMVTKRIWAELPSGSIEWRNPYAHLPLSESHVSIATMLDGLASFLRDNRPPLWPPTTARIDVELGEAMQRSIANNRQPATLPLPISQDTENSFAAAFEDHFGCHPLDTDKTLAVSFKAR